MVDCSWLIVPVRAQRGTRQLNFAIVASIQQQYNIYLSLSYYNPFVDCKSGLCVHACGVTGESSQAAAPLSNRAQQIAHMDTQGG
eukprot:1023520-Pyramimonas_sp.AAC.1